MTVIGMENLILSKSMNRTEIKLSENIAERIFTALKKIAFKTTPQNLLVYDKTGIQVIRKLGKDCWIKMPVKLARDAVEDIDIDDELLDAVAYYVIAGLEPKRASINLALFYDTIADYELQMFEAVFEEEEQTIFDKERRFI